MYKYSSLKFPMIMATVIRQRRFVLFLVFCFMTYLMFSWYIKEEPQNVNDVTVEIEDATILLNQEPDINDWKLDESIPTYVNNEFMIVTEESHAAISDNYDDSTTEENELELSKRNMLRLKQLRGGKPPSLFHNYHVTFPEDANSGPTDDGDDSLYIRKLIEKASRSFAVTEPMPTQAIISSVKDMERLSKPINEDNLNVTEAIINPEHLSNHKVTEAIINPAHLSDQNVPSDVKTTDSGVKSTKNPALIIDTSGCRIPKIDPYDPSIKHLIEIRDPITCSDKPLLMTPLPHGIVHLNVDVLKKHYNATPEDITCWYQAVLRKHENPGNVRENDYKTSEVEKLEFDKILEDEFLATKCIFNDNRSVEQYMPLVQLKKEVEDERSKIKSSSPLNVILLGIDSISKLNFMRHFRKTKAFIKENMKPFDMKGYTKVGDNTFPNLVPMLTGHFVEYYWNETVRDTFFFDNVSLIWKDYAKAGFRTLYAEDSPYTGTFNYIKRGFYDPPTDYYYRPMGLAIENSDFRYNNRGNACIYGELETDLMYDYLKNFVQTMGERPYFAFVMVSILTHDYLNSASYADAPAARILKDLQDRGAFNNSAIVIFSDHGLRFGPIRKTYVGKFEERMPFMYIHFPRWFLDQHPEFEKNLAINQERLMTLFDLHATMKHLLHLDGEPTKEPEEHGISLLNEIPENRTCKDASILEHWCPCNSFKSVPVTDPVVVKVSQTLVDHINTLLVDHHDVCSKLEVDEVNDARLGLPNEVVLKFERHDNVVENRTVVLGKVPPTLGDYLITLTMKPGGAVFEGTVRYDEKNKIPKILGISRINMYGKQSWCINSQKLKLYCYCKIQQT